MSNRRTHGYNSCQHAKLVVLITIIEILNSHNGTHHPMNALSILILKAVRRH